MRRATRVVVPAVALVLLSGCGVLSKGVYDTPLPGGADVGSNPTSISADFEDVLDLVPQSSVKVDDVSVGRVSAITLNPGARSARVKLLINSDVALPAGTTARLEQTSLLGEKYVALVRPAEPVAGPAIRSGAQIALAQTSQSAQVEQVLGALSLVLNGGGIGQFQEISRELQAISTDRPEEIKGFLTQMESFVTSLDKRKESITTALDGLNALSKTLETDKAKIVTVLDGLSPGMKVLVEQRKQFVAMLSALDRLSDVTVDTLDSAQDDIVADLKALDPILSGLAKSGSDLPNSLQILLTYPFPDSVLGAVKGDYLNVFVQTNFRTLPAGCVAIGCAWSQVADPNQPAAAPAANGKAYKPPAMKRGATGAPSPTLLPPTSSPAAGMPDPTMTVPSPSASPSGSASPSPSPSGSPSPSESPSGSPSPSPDSSPSASTTPKEGDN